MSRWKLSASLLAGLLLSANVGWAQASPSPGDLPASPPRSGGRPDDYPLDSKPAVSKTPDRPLTPAERRALALQSRVRKAVDARVRRQPNSRSRFARKGLQDSFVIGRLEVPQATRVAEVRFEVVDGVDASVDAISNYLLSTPNTSVRDYTVVGRFSSRDKAEDALLATRKQYDATRAYQMQLLAYLQKQQQIRAVSMRRC